MSAPRTGPARYATTRYIRKYIRQRQERAEGWNELEQALVGTLIDWRVDCDMRPSSGEGSDCSDLMNVALARLTGLIQGDLTPEQVLANLHPELYAERRGR